MNNPASERPLFSQHRLRLTCCPSEVDYTADVQADLGLFLQIATNDTLFRAECRLKTEENTDSRSTIRISLYLQTRIEIHTDRQEKKTKYLYKRKIMKGRYYVINKLSDIYLYVVP